MSDAERYGPYYDSETDWPDCTQPKRAAPEPATPSEPSAQVMVAFLRSWHRGLCFAGPMADRDLTMMRTIADYIEARAPLTVSQEVRAGVTDRRFLTWLAYRLENAGTEKPETVQRLRQIAGTDGEAERIIASHSEGDGTNG